MSLSWAQSQEMGEYTPPLVVGTAELHSEGCVYKGTEN